MKDRIKLEGKEAFFACVAAGVPMDMKQDPNNRGRVIMEIKVPCAAYMTKDGQIQVFQGPNNEASPKDI
jgi:hypothetical protein